MRFSFFQTYLFDVQFLQRRNLNHTGHGANFTAPKLTKMNLTVHTTTQPNVLVGSRTRPQVEGQLTAHARKITGAFRQRHARGNWDAVTPSWLQTQRKVTFLLISKPFPSSEMIKYRLFYNFIYAWQLHLSQRSVFNITNRVAVVFPWKQYQHGVHG